MSKGEFKKYIESIGFEYNDHYDHYYYKDNIITIMRYTYFLTKGSKDFGQYDLNNLIPMIKITRGFKLKKILG